jgi:hypothetical protein
MVDGSISIDERDILQKYAPKAMIFQSRCATIRWVGQEEGYTSDTAWNSLSRYDAMTGIATQKHGNPDGDVCVMIDGIRHPEYVTREDNLTYLGLAQQTNFQQ